MKRTSNFLRVLSGALPSFSPRRVAWGNRAFALCLLFFAFVLSSPAFADTNVSGLISSNTTWTLANSPYIVTGSVLVNSGVTLTIEPGVIVKFDSLKALQIDGTLIARGNSSNKITFTSNQSSPAAGDWGYILFSDSSIDATYDVNGNYTGGSIMEYAVVEYAGGADITNENGAVRLKGASPFVNFATIRSNAASGIYVSNTSAMLKITNSIISNNSGSFFVSASIGSYKGGGIYIAAGSGSVNISRNIISDNTVDATYYGTYGGGIYIVSGTITISNNIICNNTADYYGGIYSYYGAVTISNNIICNNTASIDFSAMRIDNDTTSKISNNSIIGNINLNLYSYSDTYIIEIRGESGSYFNYNTATRNTGPINTFLMRNYSSQPINNNNFSNGSPIYELYNLNSQGTSTVNAENNWWGTAIESEIQAKIYDWFDDATKGIVDYTPWDTTIRTDAPISPPTGLTATITAPGTIALSWNANPESDTAGYKVYWDTDSGYPYANSVDVGNVTSYTITGITNGIAAAVTAHDTGYNPANDDPNTIVNENQTNGNESWFSNEFADLSPATTTASPSGGTYGTSVSVTLSCNDGTGSGCTNTYYCLGTGCTPTTQYTGGTINITSSTDLRFYSTDNAGNSEGIKTEIYAITYNLAVNKSGSGSVASTSPADVIIDCGDICGGNYNQGTLVTLVATPDSGSTFAGWSGDCDSNGQVTMNADKTCTATFAGIPNILSSVSSLNFGDVNVNTTSPSQTVIVTNVGTANLSISAVTLTGTNSSEYTKQVDTCSGNTLSPSQGCSVQIAFMPASAGAKTAGLAITSNDPDTPALDIPLSGTGIQQSTQQPEEPMGVVLSCPTNVTAGSALTVTVKLYNYDCTNSISVNRLMMQLMGNSSGTLMGLGIWGPYNKWITAKTVSQATCDEYGNVTPGGPVSFSLAIMSQTPTSLSGKMSEVTVDAITSKGESLGSGSCFVNVSGAQ